MGNVRASVNQQCQIGVETTRFTPVAAAKLLSAFVWTFGPKVTTKQFRGTGRQYPSASALLTEYSAGKISGPLDFGQSVYPLSSLYGAATIAAHGVSTTAKDWTWKPPLVGSYASAAKTFTVQQGDAVDAEQYPGLCFTGFGYSFTRKQEAQLTGDWMAQTFTDGISLTASPTNVVQSPATGAMFNLYLDSTSAGIGGTQLSDPLSVAFAASGYYDGYWPTNRTNASLTDYVDKEKKNELKFKLQANSTAIAIRGSYLEVGTLAYVRVDGLGPLIDVANSVKAEFKHDMAVFISDVSELGDTDGVYGVEYTAQVAEDTTWTLLAGGTAQQIVATSLLAAL